MVIIFDLNLWFWFEHFRGGFSFRSLCYCVRGIAIKKIGYTFLGVILDRRVLV